MSNYSIFSVLGIEIEYMLVDKDTLDIQPKSDLILSALAGTNLEEGNPANEVALGDIAVSNELVMHVIELKNNGPKSPKIAVKKQFQQTINDLQPLLLDYNLILLPTGAHPWMNPLTETVRWPHGNRAIYQQFDTIFNCQGHGWSNLQSMHVNLPYANAEEFYQLHNLIRLILPLLPALAASSPFLAGQATGLLDSRLSFYSTNQQRIPAICGDLIPEFITSEEEYEQKILNPMYQAIAPFDPQGILQHPWLNSRGAILKPDQKAIEIRIIDSQECVNADIAIAKAINAILKYWNEQSHFYLDHPCITQDLRRVFDGTLKTGLNLVIDDKKLLQQWQVPQRSSSVRQIWAWLLEQVSAELDQSEQVALELILSQGNLSERILRFVQELQPAHPTALKQAYTHLTHCLLYNEQLSLA